MEFEKHQKVAEDLEAEYSSVREQIDQLPEDMEPLKVQHGFVVSLCLEAKNSFRKQRMLLLKAAVLKMK